MVLELFGTIDYLKYVGPEPRMPGLEVEVREPVSGRRSFIAPIDTGFGGYLLVPKLLYAELGMMELPEEDFGSYSTMTVRLFIRAVVRLSALSYRSLRESTAGRLIVCVTSIRELPGIRQYQIVQEERTRISVKIVPRLGFDEKLMTEWTSRFSGILGENVKIEAEVVSSISMEERRKYRYVMSKVN